MANRTLFENFNILAKHPEEFNNNSSFSCIDSILEHLRNMLNSRQGSALIADNYGMPDLTNFPGEDLAASVAELERLMKTTIEMYEPRLTNIKISYNPDANDNLTLRFNISAEIVATYGESNQQPIFFETVITSDGVIEVEG